MKNIEGKAEEGPVVKTFMTRTEFNILLDQGMTRTDVPTKNGINSYRFEGRIHEIRKRPGNERPYEVVHSYDLPNKRHQA